MRLLGPEGVHVAHEVFKGHASPDAATAAGDYEPLEDDGIACWIAPQDGEATLCGSRRIIVVKATHFAPLAP